MTLQPARNHPCCRWRVDSILRTGPGVAAALLSPGLWWSWDAAGQGPGILLPERDLVGSATCLCWQTGQAAVGNYQAGKFLRGEKGRSCLAGDGNCCRKTGVCPGERLPPSNPKPRCPKEGKKKGISFQRGSRGMNFHITYVLFHCTRLALAGRAELTAGAWGEWRLEEQRAPPQLSGLFWLPLIISQHQQACTLLQALPFRHTIENNISYASLREIYIDIIIWD